MKDLQDTQGPLDDPWPPSDAKPGDKWGAYVMCDGGWWRLDSESELAWWSVEP